MSILGIIASVSLAITMARTPKISSQG